MATAKKQTKAKPKTKAKPEDEYCPEELWDRQLNENQQQYEKFCAYRDMKYIAPSGDGVPKVDISLKRSIRGLCNKTGYKRQTLEALSIKYQWQARCEAYDIYISNLVKAQNEENIKKMQDTHAAIASEMLKKATRRLLTIKDADISVSDLVRLVDIGVKIERLSRGESTENQKVSGEVAHSGAVKVEGNSMLDLSSLSDAELGQLEQLLEKLHK